MKGVSVLLFLGTLAKWTCSAVFLNNRPFPTYSLENMPATQFSCREKILGGYYADPDTQCQMFHICVKVAGIGVQDFRFLCPNGTAFDQDHQICADWGDVDCDATTLYYSSDNFDLYRVGSGFESKAHKYGEDEETFALQRAETGDARINRDPQTQVVNQQRDYQRPQSRRNNYNNYNSNNNNNQEKDIFKGSSSSNFFNNRNNGKENDEDYDDNVNVNQNRDFEQKRKIIRKQHRRPAQQQTPAPIQQQTPEQQQPSRRPQRPTGFQNNFAGSSITPTTTRPSSTSTTTSASSGPYSTSFAPAFSSFRIRGPKPRNPATSTDNSNNGTPTYTISTPAPFRQNPAVNRAPSSSQNNGQYFTSSTTENYPQPKPTSSVANYDVPKITKQQTENYPSNNPQYAKPTTPFAGSQYNTGFEKKHISPKKFEGFKPTTFSPNAKPFGDTNTQNQNSNSGFPTTLAPRTQQAYTQIAQQTQKAQNPNTYSTFSQQSPSTFAHSPSTTQRSTTYTQYTPTVPKIFSTTPVSGRSNRFDETQYDDGSYDPKYDYNGGEDEFLKTAHSQNIASSRNELARAQKQQPPLSTTQKPYEAPRTYSTVRPTENYPSRPSQSASTRNIEPVNSRPPSPVSQPISKKVKDVSYDYAYYDSLGPEPDYQLDTEIKKSSAKN